MVRDMETKEKKYRVQLDFSEKTLRELDELQSKLNAASRAEVIRNALGILRWATRHLMEGNKILVERSDGKQTEVDFPFLLINADTSQKAREAAQAALGRAIEQGRQFVNEKKTVLTAAFEAGKEAVRRVSA